MNANLADAVTVSIADLDNIEHQQAIRMLTNHYACDELAGGKTLPEDVLQRLVDGLRKHPTTIVFLAWLDKTPVGIANCFLGFSTFAAKPLINIHDLAVHEDHRGKGVGRKLLSAVEAEAKKRGCCKLTLEVLQNNQRALQLYSSFGFGHASYSPTSGGALFYAKPL